MKKLLVVIGLLLVAATVYASTDYTCMNRCLAQGYLYAYCQRVCSY